LKFGIGTKAGSFEQGLPYVLAKLPDFVLERVPPWLSQEPLGWWQRGNMLQRNSGFRPVKESLDVTTHLCRRTFGFDPHRIRYQIGPNKCSTAATIVHSSAESDESDEAQPLANVERTVKARDLVGLECGRASRKLGLAG
jgi:hypothetical protein